PDTAPSLVLGKTAIRIRAKRIGIKAFTRISHLCLSPSRYGIASIHRDQTLIHQQKTGAGFLLTLCVKISIFKGKNSIPRARRPFRRRRKTPGEGRSRARKRWSLRRTPRQSHPGSRASLCNRGEDKKRD